MIRCGKHGATIGYRKISQDYWKLLERGKNKKEGERELKKERESGPAAIPGIPVNVELPALFSGLISPIFSSCNKPTKTPAHITCIRARCLD